MAMNDDLKGFGTYTDDVRNTAALPIGASTGAMNDLRGHDPHADEKESNTPKIVAAIAVVVGFGLVGAFAYQSSTSYSYPLVAAKQQVLAAKETTAPLPQPAASDIAPTEALASPPPPAPIEKAPEPVKPKVAAAPAEPPAVRIARAATPAAPPPEVVAPQVPLEAAPVQPVLPEPVIAAPVEAPAAEAPAPAAEQPVEATPAPVPVEPAPAP